MTEGYEECPDCEDGAYYEDTSNSCSVPIGDCCGGCGHMIRCETCYGTGEIEIEIEE
jgi:hypothetical protein